VGFAGQLEAEGAAAPVSIELTPESLALAPEGRPSFALALTDIEELHDDNYTLRLTDHTGSRYALSMLGKAYGQLLAELRTARDAALERDLLLRGVGLKDTFPAKVFGRGEPIPADVRLYEDLLVVRPERGTMFGIPLSFVEEVTWDDSLYQVHVRTDDGDELVLGHLAKRAEELIAELRRQLEALAARTARTLTAIMPGAGAGGVRALASEMRDGRAVARERVEGIDPGLWPLLETAVAGERREAYDALVTRGVAGWTSFGVKAVRADAEPEPGAEAPAADETARRARTWYFVPLAREGTPVNLIAQEVTSGEAHATYLFRVTEPGTSPVGPDDVRRSVARLNRALLLLNFRREPLYLPEDRLDEGEHARYRVAVRKLDYLRWARGALVARVAHDAGWEKALDEAIASA
jgi:hypothetical protein